MSNYNFLDLSPADFEELSRDLLEKKLSIDFESFSDGKDEGIDLRYSEDKSNDIVVQCKRYSRINDLKSTLKKEASKVKMLSPKRYILITSIDLTPHQKQLIKDIFSGVHLRTGDILCKKDINKLLKKYPEVEKAHFKLWLTSTTILNRILHSGISVRSEEEVEKLKREIKIFVHNESSREAIEILNENSYIIISGIPGIGKTTLAKMILYYHLKEGWEVVTVSKDIMEADEVFIKDKKQIFYYDDFLGTNFLSEFMSKNEDKRIIQFLQRVKNSKDKKIVLTTREYILNQAKSCFENFKDKSLEIGKCTLDIKKYTKMIKGQILYNHLYYSEVEKKYVENLLIHDRFFNILNHPNYNPRLIQYLTEKDLLAGINPSNYYDYFIENLVNPNRIWEYAFNSHISPISRFLLITLFSTEDPIKKDDLFKSLSAFFVMNQKYYGITFNMIEYNKALKECEDTFITIYKDEKNSIFVQFQNPSIKDYLSYYLSESGELIVHLLKAAIYLNQYFILYKYFTNSKTGLLNEKNQRLFFAKLKKVVNTAELSELIYYYNLKLPGLYLDNRKLSPIERLEKLSSILTNENSKYIIDFIKEQFVGIDYQEIIDDSGSMKKYLSVLFRISDFITYDIHKLIASTYETEEVDAFRYLEVYKQLKETYPNEYENYCEANEKNVKTKIISIIENEFKHLEIFSSESGVNEYLEELTTIKSEYNIPVDEYEEQAQALLEEIQNKASKKDKGVEIESKKVEIYKNEYNAIVSLFKTLL